MKLATFTHQQVMRIGVIDGESVVDLTAAAPDLPREMVGFLERGPTALATARDAATTGKHRLPLSEVRLEAPVFRPPKFLGIGLNYADHVRETGKEIPAIPMVFNKQSTCVTGPGGDIHIPRVSQEVDYEGELGFVIGRRCRHVSKERAPEVIAGYLVVNDVSVRDWQFRSPTFIMGKSFDTHGPTGPWIVTGDEIGDPHALAIKTWVNGELRQNSNTRELIFNCFNLVAFLSTAFTLEPGDIISTGTPSGVAIGFDPPKYVKAGDVMRIEIEKIGAIENRCVPEPAGAARID